MTKTNLSFDFTKIKPQIAAKLIEELTSKGFYSNGTITCSNEQDEEVMEIIDKYLLMNRNGTH